MKPLIITNAARNNRYRILFFFFKTIYKLRVINIYKYYQVIIQRVTIYLYFIKTTVKK